MLDHQAQGGGNFKADSPCCSKTAQPSGSILERCLKLNPTVLDFLLRRRSAPIAELREPAPDDTEIRTILTAATRVPDHGRLAPWRFILYRGEMRHRVGEKLAELAQARNGPLTDVARKKELERFSRAPLVIGIVHRPVHHPTIPDWEKFLSGGAVAMNLVLAANALGYRTNWITNWYADDAEGRRLLGIAPDERVIGFVHVGTFHGEVPDRERPEVDALVSEYDGAWQGV